MIHSYTCLLVFLGLAFSPALRGSPATTTDPAKLVKVKAKATPADEWKE